MAVLWVSSSVPLAADPFDRLYLFKASFMSRQFVNELRDGETVDEIYLVADRQLRANRNGDLYFLTQLRDRTGQISGLVWNVTEESVAEINVGDYISAQGKVQLFQGNLQMILNRISRHHADGMNVEDFVPQPKEETGQQLERLKEVLLNLADTDLRSLMETFLTDEEILEGLKRAPAGIRLHHAFHGGLLEHIVNLTESAFRLRDLYPTVNFDLLLVGIFLHDLGKLWELGFETTFTYTDEGQLIGHLVIGVEVLSDKIRETEQRTGTEFPREKTLRLKHMILSHHGTYEYGSPKLPMTPEAVALHHLDNLDAKVNEFSNLIESDPNTSSNWTPYQANMQRKLFKGTDDWSD